MGDFDLDDAFRWANNATHGTSDEREQNALSFGGVRSNAPDDRVLNLTVRYMATSTDAVALGTAYQASAGDFMAKAIFSNIRA